MPNRDNDFIITDLCKRLIVMEKLMDSLIKNPDKSDEDWDNATLMQEWQISPRTAINYRHKGLESFKRGGRVFYSPEQRRKFVDHFEKGQTNE